MYTRKHVPCLPVYLSTCLPPTHVHHPRRSRRLWQDFSRPLSRGLFPREGAYYFLHARTGRDVHRRADPAARAQIVEQVIQPRLKVGEIVICDRYADSTIAYQGYGHQQDLEQVRALVHYATGGLVPDLTILLDVDVEIGLKRKTKNQSEWNRLDAYELGFHRRVRAGYLEMVKQEPGRWRVVDAGREWQSVQEELRQVIAERIDT
jgi:hypothetical protein